MDIKEIIEKLKKVARQLDNEELITDIRNTIDELTAIDSAIEEMAGLIDVLKEISNGLYEIFYDTEEVEEDEIQ